MRLRGFKGFTYGDWLLLCFCLGLGAGMALALMFGDYGVQEGMLWAGAAGELGREAKRRAFLELLRQRAAGCMAGWRAAGVSALSGRPAASGNSLRSSLGDYGGLGRTEGKTGAFFSGFVSAGNHGGWGLSGDVDSPSEEPVMEIFFACSYNI